MILSDERSEVMHGDKVGTLTTGVQSNRGFVLASGESETATLSSRDTKHNGQDDGGGKLVMTRAFAEEAGVLTFAEDAVSFTEAVDGSLREASTSPTLLTAGGHPGRGYAAARIGASLRRLTPVECERLMSWPDGWTAVDGDSTPDGRRWAACGDGVVSNVTEWIGRRILAVDRM